MIEIPCVPGTDSSWTQRTALAGREYVLVLDWSQRDGHWRLTLQDASASTIATCVLVSGYPLLWGVTDPRRPPGELLVVDTVASPEIDPGFADLGARHALLYFEAGELA